VPKSRGLLRDFGISHFAALQLQWHRPFPFLLGVDQDKLYA
jgi:hypothetical protein